MKSTLKTIIILILSSITLSAGVLRELDLSPYKALFPDSLKKGIQIEFINQNYTYLRSNYKAGRLLYKGESIKTIKFKYEEKEIEVAVDTLALGRTRHPEWISFNYEYDKETGFKYRVFYNIIKDSSFLVKNITIIEDMLHVYDQDSLARVFIRSPWMEKDGNLYSWGAFWDRSEDLDKEIYLLYKYSNNKWEKASDNKVPVPVPFGTPYFFHIKDNGNIIYHKSKLKIFEIDAQTREHKLVARLDTCKTLLNKLFGESLSSLIYNPITDEIMGSISHHTLFTYSMKTGEYKYETNFKEILGANTSYGNLSQLDSRSSVYLLYSVSPGNHFFIVRENNGSYTKVMFPASLPTPIPAYTYQLLLDDKDNVYFQSYDNEYPTLVYNHYQSGVEDDYFGKAILFKEPYPNPVEFGKVTGNFFSMPFIINGLTMDLYDITGKKILDLSNQIDYNPGTGMGSYSFSTDGLSKGMYYLIFNSSNYKDCKPIFVK